LQKVEQETLKSRATLCASGELPVQDQKIHVQVTLFPIIENGRVEGLYGLIEDTTELFQSEQKRHLVDEQLNETQKYLREVLENSRDMIFLTDPAGNILTFNSGAELVLGFTRDEVVGTPAARLCANPGVFAKLFTETMRDGHAAEYEAEFRSKDMRAVICNISLTLIDGPDGKPLEVVCLCRDITTRLQLKNDLIRSERLAAVGQMAAGVAHEINNPLAVIDTIAGLVEETLADEGDALKPDTRQVLGKAMNRLHHQVQRVTTITHSLLGFVRSEKSGMVAIDIGELLEECVSVLGTEVRRSRAEIVRFFAPGIPEFTSDPLLLQQVFVNLIKNALDAMIDARDRPSILEIATSLDADRILITFQDNGVGIRSQDQEKIFNLFHTTKPAGQGTGLGLSIVHDILYRLGGNIRVASDPGKWTRFIVELPLNPPETPRPDPSISL
jgi:PAS domain S-box-containing protein